MGEIQAVSVIITVLVCAAKGFVIPAGKCDTDRIQTCYVRELDYRIALSLTVWKVVYGTYAEEFKQVDQVSATFTRNDDCTHTVHVKIILSNFTSITQDVKLTYNETVITEEVYDNETGEHHQFKIYPLAITSDNALLFYRCSERGGLSEDTRYIVNPAASTLCQESLRQLMEHDEKQDFHGELVELPYKINTRLSASSQNQNNSDICEPPSGDSEDPL